MPGFKMTGKVLKWGNSYGIRVSKADFERAKLQVGQDVDLDLLGKPGLVDLSHIRPFRSPDRFPGWSHDDVLHLARLEKLLRSGNIKRAEFEKDRKALEAKYARR